MATLTRRFIMICLVVAIFAMLLAAVVANADQNGHRSYARFCSSLEGPSCLTAR